MGNCLSAVVQQVVSELNDTDDNNNNNNNDNRNNHNNNSNSNNNNNNNNNENQHNKPSTWAQAAGGSSGGDGQQQQHHTTTTATTTTDIPDENTTATSSQQLSAIYHQLPKDAKLISVRNVYDGDTMTLIDERRIRLLGIDTPEIKEQQPYAIEAKQYTKHLIDTHSNQIYMSFDSNQCNHEDHYGRLLAYVYVQQGPNQYLCINEGIVLAGYAHVYTPNVTSKIQSFDKYIDLQNNARHERRGMWNTFVDTMVIKTMNGSAYHQKSCSHISHSHNTIEIKVSIAMAEGLHPCRTCCTGAA